MDVLMSDFDYHYKVYIDKVIGLVATMTIKSSKEAIDMNYALLKRVKNTSVIDWNNPYTWPYYQNIAGEYHPTDEVIEVISMDTTERIVFNKENLKLHKNTKKEYSYGTHKYEELIERYPTKELLIKGILNPCNIEDAIEAKDGTILSYSKSFVEINEYTLIEKLQQWIYGYFKRWYQSQYNLDNEYYNLTFMGVFYTKLVEAILTIRLENCLTNEAHSYHYRRFLASHGLLDFYLDQLTIRQALIFYKNIRWVEKYIGQKFTQRWLIEKVLTLRNLPIAEYNMVHSYLDLIDRVDALGNKVTGNVVPKPMFEKISLNGLESVLPEIDTLSLKEMLDKEDPQAFYNVIEREQEEVEAKKNLSGSLDSFLKSKVLQSKAIDYSGSENFKLDNTLIDQWIDMVKLDKYKAYVIVQHPMTGETIPLSGKNALLLFTLATFKVNKVNDDCIPDYIVGMTSRSKRPTRNDIRSVVLDNSLISDYWVDYLIESFIPLSPIMNTVDFYEQAYARFNLINHLIDYASQDEHLDARAYKEATVFQLFATKVVSLRSTGEMTFSDFLKNIAFDSAGMGITDWERLATDIWKKATGLDGITVNSLYNTHKAMISLMTKLSSYSVHYIREINEQSITPTKMLSIRIDGGGTKTGKNEFRVLNQNLATEILDDKTKGNQESLSEDYYKDAIRTIDYSSRSVTEYYLEVDVRNIEVPGGGRPIIHQMNWFGSSVYVEPDDLTGLDNPMGLEPLPGMRSWLELDIKTRRVIADQFGTDLVWDENGKDKETPREPLDWNFVPQEIDGLNYTNE